MKWQIIIPLFLLAVSLNACYPAPSSVDTEVVRQEITDATQSFVKAFNLKNAETLSGMYTENAMLMPPNAGISTGRDEIRQYWQEAFEGEADRIELEITEVFAHLTETWVTGSGSIYDAEGSKFDEIKFITGWQRVEEKWMIYRNIWNSSMPAPESTMEEPGMETSAEQETM